MADDLTDGIDTRSTEQCESLDIWCNVEHFSYDVFRDFVELFQDGFAWVFDQFLSLFISILNSLPVPEIDPIDWSGMAPIFYFADRLGIDVAIGILGAGLAFRLLRKFVTLGQW